MLRTPDDDTAELGARALRTTVAGSEPFTGAPAALLEAVSRDVFGRPLDAGMLAPIGFDEVAASLTDPEMRHQLVGAAIALGMTVHPTDPAIAGRARDLAAALDADDRIVDAFEQALEGHRHWMLYDYARQSWMADEVKAEIREHGIRSFVEQIARVKGHGPEDAATIERFAGLADYPAGSWGHGVHEFYERHRWPLPGQRGSVPMVTTHHDWVHVASGYDATPLGELQVTAFMAAQMPQQAGLSIMFFGWSIYETGLLKVPLSPGAVGTLSAAPDNPRQVADALRRGAASGVDLLDLDHWAHAHRPLVEIREEYGVGPKHLPGPDAVPSVPTAVEG